MATAIEYGLIAAGISLAIITAVHGIDANSRWNDKLDKKKAAAACAARGKLTDKVNSVEITSWLGRDARYECSNWPSIFYPTQVR